MSRANIYIRKENEKAWEALLDKSAWVNERLEKDDFVLAVPKARQAFNTPLTPKEPAPSSANWTGPIFRDKKKGKL